MTPRLLICAGLVGLLGLAACGKQGTLDRPGPLFGSTRSEARREREAAARANQQPNADAGATSQTNGDYSQASDGAKDPALLPFRSSPPQGAINPSGGTGGNGLLPDPIADPNRIPR
jgi:hypothetical protein